METRTKKGNANKMYCIVLHSTSQYQRILQRSREIEIKGYWMHLLTPEYPTFQEMTVKIQLRAFGDASIHGVCATVNAVVTEAFGVSQC